jgi:site-specific recombinase XerC
VRQRRSAVISTWRPESVTLSDWSRRWLQALAAKGYSPETLKNYKVAVDQYLGHLIETSHLPNAVSSFTPQTVDGFAKMLHEYKLKPQSAVIKLSALDMFARWLMRQEADGGYVLAANPLDRVERPRRQRPREAVPVPRRAGAVRDR